MVVFNYLLPALVVNLTVQNTFEVGNGSLSTGGTLVLGHIYNGTIASEPGFETPIQGIISKADDWPTVDASGLYDRPDIRGLVSTDDGEYLELLATGLQTINPQLGAIITGAGSGSLAFGEFQSVFFVTFRTGAAKYKNLENSLFVGSETVKSITGGKNGDFKAGLRISKLYSTKTDVHLE